MAEAHLGALQYGVNTIIPAVTVDAPNGDGTVLAGEVIPFTSRSNILNFGVMGDKDKDDGEIAALGVNQHFIVRKLAGAALSVGDFITFKANADATKNDYVAEVAASTDVVYGQVMTAAASADVTVHIHGPYYNAGNNYFTVT